MRLELDATSEFHRSANRVTGAVLELDADDRVSTRATLHRLFGDRDLAAFDDQFHVANVHRGVRALEVVAEDESRMQPGERDGATDTDHGPGMIRAIHRGHVRQRSNLADEFR